ncbi:MAG: amidohydrolase family protein [Pseudomonadota bacterium]
MTYPNAMMPPDTRPTPKPLPANACDTHVHMVAGPEFPLWDGRVENPAPGQDFDGWLQKYTDHIAALGCTRGVLVHSILYGTDNRVTLQAVKQLGHGFKGVGLLPDDATDKDLDGFADAGIKALRLNYVHGGVLTWDGAKALAPRLADRGMHLQMLLNTHKHMVELVDDIRALPVPLVIDHMGWPDLKLGPDEAGFETLTQLLADGQVHVKLSALYRLCPPPYDQADTFVDRLLAANPDGLLWGSDWPHLMLNDAEMPDGGAVMDTFLRTVTRDDHLQKILVDTPARLFDF